MGMKSYRIIGDPLRGPSSGSRCFQNSRWGLAVLLLAQCSTATHCAVWSRESSKDYYHQKFESRSKFGSSLFAEAKKATPTTIVTKMRGGGESIEIDETCNNEVVRPSSDFIQSAQPVKQQFAQRFSRLSKRLPKRPVDCCSDCQDCMSSDGMIEYGCDALMANIPRGGHLGGGTTDAIGGVIATPCGLPLNAWKVIFQIFLTTINVVCWLVPLRSKKISENKLGLSLANAFSGGVFLSLAFGHLIPECIHGFGEVNEALPYMIVLCGYLLIFFVEKVAFDAHDILHEMEGVGALRDAEESSPAEEDSSNGFSGRSAVILLGALAVHSILEMTALGLADTFGDSALLTLSIALHQLAESIALLVAFLKSGMPKHQIVQFLSIFSCMGPIGVAIGMAVNSFATPIVDATMLAVVAGTFVYVGATEIIPEEWEDSDHKWTKFASLIAGIVSILVITQYTATLEGS